MKKNNIRKLWLNEVCFFKKLLRYTSLTALLLAFSVLQIHSKDFMQYKQITVNVVDEPLETIFKEIESKSDFNFFYEASEIDVSKKVTLSVSNSDINEILDIVFRDSDIEYEINNRYIILSNKKGRKKSLESIAQDSDRISITGRVTDAFDNQPIPFANVLIIGTSRGTVTDIDGVYELNVNEGDSISFSFIGYETQKIKVGKVRVINIMLSEQTEMLEEAVVVAFGKQSKESVVSSITTVNTRDLRVPSSNLTTALAGKMAGLVAYQTTGAPGEDNAQFFVRSVTSFGSGLTSPLILIDNMEATSNDLGRLNPDDIESFSILKDASATALYGARGANGVVLVTTKEGQKGAAKVSVRVESSLSRPTKDVDIADPIRFMEYSNIASMTRHDRITYDQYKIDMTKNPNRNKYVYPAIDWRDELTQNHAFNHRANLNVSGGGDLVTYYLAGSFTQDNGILQVDPINPFNTNIDFKKYTIRSNINLNLTRRLEAKLKVSAGFDEYTGPIGEYGSGGKNTYNKALLANPVLFPMTFKPDEQNRFIERRILFGNYSGDPFGQGSPSYINPYADIMRGYEDVRKNNLNIQLELHENLNFLTQGLRARFIGNVTRFSGFNIQRNYKPFYYQYIQGTYDPSNEQFPYELVSLNPEGGSDFIDYDAGDKFVSNRMYAEGAILYNRKFQDKHDIGGLLVGSFSELLTGSATNLDSSLPSRNVSVAGRFTYGFDRRYFAEFNFGLNGSERFDPAHRWGFFPSIGGAWLVSGEDFWSGIKEAIPLLRLKGTYGMAGNDIIVSDEDRFFFTSNVNLNRRNAGFFGINPYDTYSRPTIGVYRYANPNITWEKSYKQNYGIEIGLFDEDLTFVAEFYKEHRTNIVQFRPDIPSTVGLSADIRTNYGEAEGKGIDLTLNYNKSLLNGMWYIIRGNFTYGTSKITQYDELDYSGIAPWRSRVGQKVGQNRGYIAERLFIDDYEVQNSPLQQVSSGGGVYQAGDIKYRDANGDGVINEFDIVPMGYPSTPEVQYGFGGSFGYKTFDFSFFFQGSARYSFFLDAASLAPFVEVWSGGNKGNRAMLNFIANEAWTESNRDPYAKWPRLSPDSGTSAAGNNNNFVNSNYWMRTAGYIRLKSVEMGYTLPAIVGVRPRVYLSGTNLFTFSDFKLWDSEMRGNGLRYPLQRVFNIGVSLTL